MHTVNVYNFNELSEEAKQKAIESFRNSDFFEFCNYDIVNTIEKISKAICCEANYYTYDGIKYFVDFISNDDFDLKGKRAYAYIVNNYLMPNKEYKTYWKDKIIHCDGRKNWKRKSKIFYNWDNCPFTGYIADYCFIEAWKKWEKNFTKESTVEDFLNILGESLGREWTEENKYQNSDEYIAETIIINEYEFLEDGRRF